MGSCKVALESGAPQAFDCLPIQALSDLTRGQQRPRRGVNAERPITVGALRVLAKSG